MVVTYTSADGSLTITYEGITRIINESTNIRLIKDDEVVRELRTASMGVMIVQD